MRHDENKGPEGYRVEAVEAWIRENVDGLTPPFRWTRLEGGHSNLTYRLDDVAGRLAVVRRPPQGQLLPKAHDMSREWALISALGPTPVPVPGALGFCESPDVTGAWFYVMGHIEGYPLYSSDDTERLVPEAQRRKMALSFIDVLADLHAVDPDEVGLGQLGKKENYVGRQLKRWRRQVEAAGVVPGLDTVDVLAAPEAGATGGALGGVAVGVAEGGSKGGEAVHVGSVGGGVAEMAHDAAVHAVGHEEEDVGGHGSEEWSVVRD